MPSLNESIVEDAALTWFGELGYALGHGPQIAPGEPAAERDGFGEVVLVGRVREAIRRLNPAIPEEAREEALRKVLQVATTSLVQTNRAFHRMLRNGVDVEYPRPDGSIKGDKARLVDFADVRANDWFAVNQFTVIEAQHNRRPDVVVFVNGLPLALIELKNAADEDATIRSAYAQLQTYKAEVPSLLNYNAVLVVMDYVDDFLFDGIYALMGEDGSVINDDGTPVLQCVWGKFWVNNHAHVLRGKNGIGTEHLLLHLKGSTIAPFVNGAVQPRLNQGDMNRIPFILPPPEIGQAFAKTIAPLFAKIRANTEQSRTLATLRDTLLPNLLGGELSVAKTVLSPVNE